MAAFGSRHHRDASLVSVDGGSEWDIRPATQKGKDARITPIPHDSSCSQCQPGEFVPARETRPESCGCQADVSILTRPTTGEQFFLKAHKRAPVFRQERRILQLLQGLHHTTPRAVCYMTRPRGIVMELASDGDLTSDRWYRHDNPRRFETIDQVVFAAANFLASLALLHHHGFVHNDLRPGNVVFHDRRMQLIDFGLSRRIGTRDVLSRCTLNSPPEAVFVPPSRPPVLINSTAVDWYTYGVLTHFLLAKSVVCVSAETEQSQQPRQPREECRSGLQEMFWPYQQMERDNRTGTIHYNWIVPPVGFTPEMVDFVAQFIVVDPMARDFRGTKLLPLLNHPLFHAIDWSVLLGDTPLRDLLPSIRKDETAE